MPSDCPALDAVLGLLECDNDWNENNLIEKGYKTAGLQRYHFNKLGSLMSLKETNTRKEEISSNSDSKQSSSAFNRDHKMKPPPLKIKIENQAFVDLQNKLKVLKTAKGQMCVQEAILVLGVPPRKSNMFTFEMWCSSCL